MANRDPRLTPARPDLAAAHLRGEIEAPRFAEGTPQQVIAGIAPVRAAPSHGATLVTEALHGERVTIYDTDDEALSAELERCAAAENDPLWRLPLWMRYDQNLDSKVADLNNIAAGGMAGSIICALFLKRFVSTAKSWLHFDIYAWTPAAKPGRPEGGECQAARALYALLARRYG